jgi:hypothetical protein
VTSVTLRLLPAADSTRIVFALPFAACTSSVPAATLTTPFEADATVQA